MEEKLGWMPARFTNEERLKLAEKILVKLKNKYNEQLIAVTLEGSTAKGTDKPFSDIEMTAIFNNDLAEERWNAFLCEGMFIGLGYDRLESVIEASKNVNYEWCLAGDRLLNAKFLYDPTNLAETLKQNSIEAIQSANFSKLAKAAFADMYEHVLKIFTIDEDNILCASLNAKGIAYWATMTVGLINKKQFISSRILFQEAKKLKLLPKEYSECIDELLALDTNVNRLREFSARLWTGMVKWLSQFQISLDDDELKGI
ncbi:kanamycin nucleotidyltransferase C-terminal domain-containing protein [Alkaliphilus serpentinus]|uniref:Kanamycin nucleotidyltransferase C-terminal domain-containing protein n=1 Tax=Alkaliphilus serpentinus TaxID=1482731 RepID=A0A833HNK9_9FIRM|nr:kanamycin nucleotidyltransferase C-terminal domain-containing protein [Alkaliphilus serpentinus]KAB3529585.1 hypothetical protein F8153_09015 [Alkaliphilus serpentinus]